MEDDLLNNGDSATVTIAQKTILGTTVAQKTHVTTIVAA